MDNNNNTDSTDILVIGCGGSGLRAAIEAKQNNLTVKVLGKRSKNDSHTVLAAGGINASFGNVDANDSWQQHFVDTYKEGYEIGQPKLIEIMAKNASKHVEEIDSWGANFQKLANGKFDQRYFGAHTYRRTCYSGDYTGQSILKALLKKSASMGIPIYDSQYVTDLLIKDGQCFGAFSFNIHSGERTVHFSDSVILCTGGHTRLWKKSSSRKLENMGDGYFLGLKAGCHLIDMEMVQFHPTGMLYPEDFAGILVTEAVRGEGGKLYNCNGERFMERYDKKRMELSTRDRVAIANYTEIVEGRATKNGGVYLDISHKDKKFIIEKIPKIYRQFIESQLLDISKSPMEVAPTAHYSMGGIVVQEEDHSTNISGLFAAGEVAGGLHGANRLGGNSLAEILVFGSMAGESAAKFSMKIDNQIRSTQIVKKADENIDRLVKKGDYLGLSIQENLRKMMWKFCGVVKDQNKLEKAIESIKDFEKQFEKMEVTLQDNNCNDLVYAFDLEASLITAKATIYSALKREESRGAHQRSDNRDLDINSKYNLRIKYEDKKIKVFKTNLEEPREDLKEFMIKNQKIEDFSGKLLE